MSAVTVNQSISLIKTSFATKRPLMLYSSPGVGKTSAVKEAAEQWAAQLGRPFPVYTFIGSIHEPTDLIGIPFPDAKKTSVKWLAPDFLPTKQDAFGVLFYDEFAQSDQAMQKAMLGSMFERKLGSHKIPDGIAIVAAGNRLQDKAGTNRVITPALNRLIHIDVEPNHEEWLSWAAGAGVHPVVMAYIHSSPKSLNNFDPKADERAFATPRTWEYASDILKTSPSESDRRVLLAGTVGPGHAAELETHIRYANQLPDLDALLKDPTGGRVPKEPAVMIHLLANLVSRFAADEKVGRPAVKYMGRPDVPTEMMAVGTKMMASVDIKRYANKLQSSPEFMAVGKRLAALAD